MLDVSIGDFQAMVPCPPPGSLEASGRRRAVLRADGARAAFRGQCAASGGGFRGG